MRGQLRPPRWPGWCCVVGAACASGAPVAPSARPAGEPFTPAPPLAQARVVEASPSRPADGELFAAGIVAPPRVSPSTAPPSRRPIAGEVSRSAGPQAEVISAVLRANSDGLRDCVADAWRWGERLAGRMEVELVIDHRGRVVAARVLTGRFRGSRLAGCAVARIKGWRFPPWRRSTRAVFLLPYLVEAPR